MKTRKEGSKARLLGLSCMALVLTAFGVTGVRADAADAKKHRHWSIWQRKRMSKSQSGKIWI